MSLTPLYDRNFLKLPLPDATSMSSPSRKERMGRNVTSNLQLGLSSIPVTNLRPQQKRMEQVHTITPRHHEQSPAEIETPAWLQENTKASPELLSNFLLEEILQTTGSRARPRCRKGLSRVGILWSNVMCGYGSGLCVRLRVDVRLCWRVLVVSLLVFRFTWYKFGYSVFSLSAGHASNGGLSFGLMDIAIGALTAGSVFLCFGIWIICHVAEGLSFVFGSTPYLWFLSFPARSSTYSRSYRHESP